MEGAPSWGWSALASEISINIRKSLVSAVAVNGAERNSSRCFHHCVEMPWIPSGFLLGMTFAPGLESHRAFPFLWSSGSSSEAQTPRTCRGFAALQDLRSSSGRGFGMTWSVQGVGAPLSPLGIASLWLCRRWERTWEWKRFRTPIQGMFGLCVTRLHEQNRDFWSAEPLLSGVASARSSCGREVQENPSGRQS